MDDRWLIQTLQTSYVWITVIILLGQHTEKAKCQIIASCLLNTTSAATPERCCKCTAQPPSFHCRELCLPGFFATEYTVGKCDPEFLNGSQSTTTEAGPLAAQNGNSLSSFGNSNTSSNESTKDLQPNFKDVSTTTSAATPNSNKESQNFSANDVSTDSFFSTSIKLCVPCHTACKGCNGPGPRNCIQCADNFERIHDYLDECVAKVSNRSTFLHTEFSGRTSSTTTEVVVPLETGSDASLAFSRASVILSAVILPFIVVLTVIAFVTFLCLRHRLKRSSAAVLKPADWRSRLSSEAGQSGHRFSLDSQPYKSPLPRSNLSSGRGAKLPGSVFCCFRKPGNRRGNPIPLKGPLYRVPIANMDVENEMSETLCGSTDDNFDYASIGNSRSSLEVQFEKSPLVSGAEDFALKSLEAGVLSSSEYLSPVGYSLPSSFSSEEPKPLSKAYCDYRAFDYSATSHQTSTKTPAMSCIRGSPQKSTKGLESKLMKSEDVVCGTSHRPLPAVREDLAAVKSQPPPLPPRNRTPVLHDSCSQILTEAWQPSVGYFTTTHLRSPAEFAFGDYSEVTTKAKNTECANERNYERKVLEEVNGCLVARTAAEHDESDEESTGRYPDETFAKVAGPFTTPDDTSSGTDDSRETSSISRGTSFQGFHYSHSSFGDFYGSLTFWNSRNKPILLYSCAPWRPVVGLPETCYASSSSGLHGTYSSGTIYGPFSKVCFIQNFSSSGEYDMSMKSMVNDVPFLPGSKARHTFTDVLDTESEPRSDHSDSLSWTSADVYNTERLEDFERDQRFAGLNSQGPSHPPGYALCAEDFLKTSFNPGAEAAELELTMKNLVSSYCTTTSTQTATAENGSDSKPTFSGAWQNEQSFGYNGGVLQPADSDVRLEVPVGAVERTQYLSIKASVSTDLRSVYAKFASLPPSEHIASPVVEYFAGHDVKFCKPVKILLPHFLPPKVSPERVSVYVFRHDQLGRLSLERLTLQSRDNARNPQSGVFYFGDDKHIVVLTDHFSGYFCTHCNTQSVSQTLHQVVFARNVEKGPGARVVDVRLEIWDDRLGIKDFEKECFERPQTANDQNMQPIDRKSLPPVSGGFDLDKLFIGAQIDFISEEGSQAWMHMKRRDGQLIYPAAVTVSMRELTACKCQRPTIPKRLDWKLSNQNGVVPEGSFECLIDVGYVTSGIVQHGDHLSLMPYPKVTFDVSVGATSETPRKAEKTHSPNRPENNARSSPARQQHPTTLHNDLGCGQPSAHKTPPSLCTHQYEAGPQKGFSDLSVTESEPNAFPTLDSVHGAVAGIGIPRAEHPMYLPGTADPEQLRYLQSPGSEDGVPQSGGRANRSPWSGTSQRLCRGDAPTMVPQGHCYPQNQNESGRFQDHHRRSDMPYTEEPTGMYPGSNYARQGLLFEGDPRGCAQYRFGVQAAYGPREALVQSHQSLQFHGNPRAYHLPAPQSGQFGGDSRGYAQSPLGVQAAYDPREALVQGHHSHQCHGDRGALPAPQSGQFHGDPRGYVQAAHASREGYVGPSPVYNTDSGAPYSGGQLGHFSGNNWGWHNLRGHNAGYSDLQGTSCHPSESCPYPPACETPHCFPSPSIPGTSQNTSQPTQAQPIIIHNANNVSFPSCPDNAPNNGLQQSANNGENGTYEARAHRSSGACDLSTYQNLANFPGLRGASAGATSTNQHVASTSAESTSTTPAGAIATQAFTGEDLLTTSQASGTASPEALANTAATLDSTSLTNFCPRDSSAVHRRQSSNKPFHDTSPCGTDVLAVNTAGLYAPEGGQQRNRNGPELSDRAEELLRCNANSSPGESLESAQTFLNSHGETHDSRYGVRQNGQNSESEEVSNASDTEYAFTMSEPVQASEESS